MKNFTKLIRLLLTAMICLTQTNLWAATEINVETAGTLSSLLTSTDNELKVTGFINGSDIKFIRQLVEAGTVTSLDWSEVKIVAGGKAYYENYTTEDDVVGDKMFYKCSKLQQMELPTTLTIIGASAFDNSGLKSIIIPDKVRVIEDDAFGGCSQLATVVIGKRVNKLEKGVFYGSAVTKAYVKPLTPPTPPSYMFSSNPTIYVYGEALADYRQSGWNNYGTLSGTLDRYYPQEPDEEDAAKELYATYFEDAAATQLKPEYQAMSDEELQAAMALDTLPEALVNIALKVKNDSWATYEKDFRIHDYKPYSDANYWNEKMMSWGGSFMGNPTGIYAESFNTKLYVFVDQDIPSDATLYMAWSEENDIISNAKTGQKLEKGLNIIDGTKNALYYILYIANTKSMDKTLSEWPNIKIHIEGGTVNGYYDVSRHSDADYKTLLNAATLNRFTVRGEHSLYHLKTATFKSVFPNSVDKSISWFDSVAVWQKNLMGMTEEVVLGKKAGAPWYLTGGEAIYPLYYNNPNFAIEGDGGAYAHSSAFLSSYNSEYCVNASLNALNPDMDDWCAGHECGHNNQRAITVEGGTEVSNNLFSNFVRYLGGLYTSVGSPLSTVMEEFASHEPFYLRKVDSQIRMYWNLYLYYHMGQRNTSFYPELFKALRNSPLVLNNSSNNNNNGGLKFVRKVCEVAGEDLTDFFTIWGFFEPVRTTIDGGAVVATASGINATKNNIAQYERKNREIIFVEDRADYVLSTGFLQAEGKKRRDSERVGQCGDLGQFWDYWPEAGNVSEYTYLKADSLYAFEGTGGVGFLMLDGDNNIKYAANDKNLCIPSSVTDFAIYSCDADGSLHEVTKAGNGTETIELSAAGRLQSTLENDQVIKLIVSGRINGRDIKYIRQLISDNNLQSIDLSQAQIVSGGGAYYQSYFTSPNTMGDYAFAGFKKLVSIKLPSSITKIGVCAFDRTGLRTIIIPDKVTTVGDDAFGSSSNLKTIVIGKNVSQLGKGTFYGSDVKDAYVTPLTPPSVGSYLFSSNPTIHVYASALEKYRASAWAEYGTIVGDLTDDIIDGIESHKDFKDYSDLKDLNVATYDLMGRRVTEMKPGNIYIRNGNKVYVK